MKIWNTRWLSLPLAAIVALGMSVPAAAQVLEIEPATEEAEAEGEAELEAAAQGGDMPNSGAVALGAGVDFASEYFFRGIVQETNGFIAQPFLEGSIAFGAATITAGTWSSLHSAAEGGDPEMWYETDFYAGVGFGAGDVGIDVTYTAYMSPNQSFGTVKEVALGFAYDDGMLGPYATFAFEVDGQADGGLNEGTYLELGVEPGFGLADTDLSLSFPVAVGLSLSDYYEAFSLADLTFINDTFGFFSVGASLGVPLSGIPSDYGSWELALGVQFLAFGDGLKAINGEDNKVIGTFGISLGY